MNNAQSPRFLELNSLEYENNCHLVKIVGQKDRDRKLITTSRFKKGDVVHNIFPYSIHKNPDFLTVQINHEEHIMDVLLEAMNHSCSPTTFVDTERMVIVAEKDLVPGDELTFFYPSTEWQMDRPFQCKCQSPNCISFVAGAKELSINQINLFRLNIHVETFLKLRRQRK